MPWLTTLSFGPNHGPKIIQNLPQLIMIVPIKSSYSKTTGLHKPRQLCAIMYFVFVLPQNGSTFRHVSDWEQLPRCDSDMIRSPQNVVQGILTRPLLQAKHVVFLRFLFQGTTNSCVAENCMVCCREFLWNLNIPSYLVDCSNYLQYQHRFFF